MPAAQVAIVLVLALVAATLASQAISCWLGFSRDVGGASQWCSTGSPNLVPLTVAVCFVHLVVSKDRNLIEGMPLRPVPVRVIDYASAMLALTLLVRSDAIAFVYSQF